MCRQVGQAVVYVTNIDQIVEDMDAVWKEFSPIPITIAPCGIGISKLVVGARIEISRIAIKG